MPWNISHKGSIRRARDLLIWLDAYTIRCVDYSAVVMCASRFGLSISSTKHRRVSSAISEASAQSGRSDTSASWTAERTRVCVVERKKPLTGDWHPSRRSREELHTFIWIRNIINLNAASGGRKLGGRPVGRRRHHMAGLRLIGSCRDGYNARLPELTGRKNYRSA